MSEVKYPIICGKCDNVFVYSKHIFCIGEVLNVEKFESLNNEKIRHGDIIKCLSCNYIPYEFELSIWITDAQDKFLKKGDI